MFSKLRAVIRLFVIFWIVLIFPLLYAPYFVISPPKAQKFARLCYGFCARVMGLFIEKKGQPLSTVPTLFISNHSSYTDILVLGSLLPAAFIAKEEVKKWPLFGWVARKQESLFITRKRQATSEGVLALQTSLLQGKNLILFPEGTSSDGCFVLPFRSSFLDVLNIKATQEAFRIQPISLVYAALDDLPMGRFLKKLYSWTGEMDLLSHLWRIVQLKKVKVIVKFHAPLDPSQFKSRKDLAQFAWKKVRQGFFEKEETGKKDGWKNDGWKGDGWEKVDRKKEFSPLKDTQKPEIT